MTQAHQGHTSFTPFSDNRHKESAGHPGSNLSKVESKAFEEWAPGFYERLQMHMKRASDSIGCGDLMMFSRTVCLLLDGVSVACSVCCMLIADANGFAHLQQCLLTLPLRTGVSDIWKSTACRAYARCVQVHVWGMRRSSICCLVWQEAVDGTAQCGAQRQGQISDAAAWPATHAPEGMLSHWSRLCII